MITRSIQLRQSQDWQTLLGQAITDPEQLLRELHLPVSLLPAALQASSGFRLRVPRGFVARMHPGDPDDPLLRQILPLGDELVVAPGYSSDPLGELDAMPVPGLLHKYRKRVLLTMTGACAVHCRYCFRRHYPYSDANPVREIQQTLDYLHGQKDVNEVILSGGDPLTLSDRRLADLVTEIETVPQLQRLRIHSRVPVVLPERINSELLAWMTATRLQVVLVIHSNHANEIDTRVAAAMQQLHAAGITLMNQSVLLRGVNDQAAALADLSEKLFAAHVLPYYLHQLDPVQGAAHFSVDDRKASALIEEVRASLPGYLVPQLVREQPGNPSKTLV
ncbi:MAG: EF-P beta-lysylation protein EpmB [Gammaproteobacteria bacterium]|nr:MAG: EF-P beta-lysylation protein EpmB [Gammaproteobacteria bacterium]